MSCRVSKVMNRKLSVLNKLGKEHLVISFIFIAQVQRTTMIRFLVLLVIQLPLAFSALASQPYVDPDLIEELKSGKSVRVIVETREREDGGPSSSATMFLQSTLGNGTVNSIDSQSAVTSLDSRGFDELQSSPFVRLIVKDTADPPSLVDVVKLSNAKTLWENGEQGSGVVIAVLDTGLDTAHIAFENRVVGEACFSISDPENGVESLCPSGEEFETGEVVQIGSGASTGCPISTDGCDHGTHVAGIAAGGAVVDPDNGDIRIAGIAKGSDIYPIQVFSRFTRAEDCSPRPAPCVLAFRSSQRRALQFIHSKVLARRAMDVGPNIVAVNMSLGGGHYQTHCDSQSALTRRIAALREDDVATLIASGNASFRDGVGHPACISHAIAVGAVAKNDELAVFTNRVADPAIQLVDMMGYGVDVRASVPGDGFDMKSGTSMATPAVAGAYALLKSSFPESSVSQIEMALKNSSHFATSAISGKQFPIVDIRKSFINLGGILEGALAANQAISLPNPASPEENPEGDSSLNGSYTRFIVETPIGESAASAASIAAVADLLATELNVGSVNSGGVDGDAFTIVTGDPIAADALSKALQKHVPNIIGVFPDFKDSSF